MTTIIIQYVPDAVHERLKMQARLHQRSLNQEAVDLLEKGVPGSESRAEALRAVQAQVAQVRANMVDFMTAREIAACTRGDRE